jgi:hypothetical protein
MTPFVIEKGIPFPPLSYRKGGGRPLKYPWHTLAVGDSVLLTCEATARAGANWGKRHWWIVAVEKQRDGSGWRLWRKA